MDQQTDKPTNRTTKIQVKRHADQQKNRPTYMLTNKKIEKPTDIQTNRQIDQQYDGNLTAPLLCDRDNEIFTKKNY